VPGTVMVYAHFGRLSGSRALAGRDLQGWERSSIFDRRKDQDLDVYTSRCERQ